LIPWQVRIHPIFTYRFRYDFFDSLRRSSAGTTERFNGPENHLRASLALLTLLPFRSFAAGLPGCARTGAASVKINGRPTLRLSDMAHCPAVSHAIIPGMMIEGGTDGAGQSRHSRMRHRRQP